MTQQDRQTGRKAAFVVVIVRDGAREAHAFADKPTAVNYAIARLARAHAETAIRVETQEGVLFSHEDLRRTLAMLKR